MAGDDATVVPAPEFSYYRDTIYWNSFPKVVDHLSRCVNQVRGKDFISFLVERHRAVESAFFLNCGNGWVERSMFQRGAVRSVIGADIGADMLRSAEEEAAKIGMPACYFVADANRLDLTGLTFQWAVNHAALHHVANIDHVVRQIWLALPPDGLFINWDYIGPHRNQYLSEAWSAMTLIWESLPPPWRAPLAYPHMPTMLAADPTEAVHSELIIATLLRYFEVIYSAPLGGALAYQLLFQNHGLYEARDTPEGAGILDRLMYEDARFTNMQLSRSLFGFIVCRPKSRAAIAQETLDRWTEEEVERESRARDNGGRYYPPTELEAALYGDPITA